MIYLMLATTASAMCSARCICTHNFMHGNEKRTHNVSCTFVMNRYLYVVAWALRKNSSRLPQYSGLQTPVRPRGQYLIHFYGCMYNVTTNA